MGSKITNFEDIREKIKENLSAYLQEKGFSDLSKINCLNPRHEDRNPSMGLVPASGDKVLHCFSCLTNYDIFDAYAILENTPMEGPGWLMATFLPLCRKYGIEVEFNELSEEDKYNYSVYRAYEQAAQIVKMADPTPALLEEVEKRQWNLVLARETFGIGSVGFAEFLDRMIALGYSKKFLEDIDLYNPKIFTEKGVTIPIRDDHNSICGFVTRNTAAKKGSRVSKFYNTNSKCPIYSKGGILFNFNEAKHSVPPLIITESYLDTITLVLKGITNVVGIGATALTDEHIELLKEYEINDIILALDFDKAGIDATAKYVEQLSGRPGLSLSVLTLPEGFQDDEVVDPEDYVRKYGIEAFKTLPRLNAFEWKLLNSDYRAEPYDLAIRTVPTIANEPNTIEREKQCNILAKHTGISAQVIKEELERICNIETAKKTELRDALIKKVVKDLQKCPGDVYNILNFAVSRIEDIDVITSQYNFSKDEYLKFLEYKKVADESSAALQYKSGFGRLDLKTSSQWAAPGTLIALGGRSNSGKTALLINLAYNIATLNEDVTVLFHTIDDSRYIVIPKFIAMDSRIKINHVITPEFSKQYYAKHDLITRREASYHQMYQLGMADRLIIKDAELGTSLESVDQWVKRYRKEYPDRKIIYFLDNFHLLADMNHIPDERVRNKERSKLIKKIATKYGITIFMTVEYTKIPPGHRPHNFDILETGQIEYDCNAIYHLFNPYSDVGASAGEEWTWMEYDDLLQESVIKPKVELITGKSKLSAFKGSYFLQFSPEISRYSEMDNFGETI